MKDKIVTILKEEWVTIGIVLALVVAYTVLRTPGDQLGTMEEIQARLTDGRPTVIEFYSNTCSICLASKPKVDQLERDIVDEAELLRLNVRDGLGQQLAYQWQVTGVPTFFVFSGEGEVAYRRAGAPDVDQIKEAVAALVTRGVQQ